MKGNPKRPDPNSSGMDAPIRTIVALTDPLAEVGPMRKTPSDINRSVYLKREDFEKYGYTPGGDGCKCLKAGLAGYKHHTPECRKRMEMAIGEDRHPQCERALHRRLEMDEPVHSPVMLIGSGQTME